MRNLTTFLIVAMLVAMTASAEPVIQHGYVISCQDGEGILLTAPGELILGVEVIPGGQLYKISTADGVAAASCDPGFDIEVGPDHYVTHIEVGDCLVPGAIRSVIVLMADPVKPPADPIPPLPPFPWVRSSFETPYAYAPMVSSPKPIIGEYNDEFLGAYIPVPWDPQPPIGE